MEVSQSFWEASIEQIKKGYIEDGEYIKCLICDKIFTIGRVYEVDGKFYDARKTAEIHIQEKHKSMLSYLLNMNTAFTGISEVQKGILELIAMGLSDKEIAAKLKVANSTIRNHRYKLREKEKQAKLFLAMMDLLSNGINKKINILDDSTICDSHKSATTLDDRFNITDEEKSKVIEVYMDENKRLKSYPAREKKKVIVLEEISKNFKYGKKYSEKEINRILARIFDDYVTLRRALIEYGFLDRSNDCSEYWVKE
ncbi:Uncharacterized protein conserved in bacteria (DUF2087) [uncultured Clostridium sp.]|uniref:DUF2087 domain-containing protein n=1 Tax=uncultured Clostridium sp. TaxID=59620 RepID=UPI000822F4F8|nr:DUF2087 domain-containing protein [uncultured Clostridium sp.]SCJ60796.1 Uncharacterized protein conserved in bacteria (DUF2087) [uncultured Clostridium sp.]